MQANRPHAPEAFARSYALGAAGVRCATIASNKSHGYDNHIAADRRSPGINGEEAAAHARAAVETPKFQLAYIPISNFLTAYVAGVLQTEATASIPPT